MPPTRPAPMNAPIPVRPTKRTNSRLSFSTVPSSALISAVVRGKRTDWSRWRNCRRMFSYFADTSSVIRTWMIGVPVAMLCLIEVRGRRAIAAGRRHLRSALNDQRPEQVLADAGILRVCRAADVDVDRGGAVDRPLAGESARDRARVGHGLRGAYCLVKAASAAATSVPAGTAGHETAVLVSGPNAPHALDVADGQLRRLHLPD